MDKDVVFNKAKTASLMAVYKAGPADNSTGRNCTGEY
jgi:hypothetical protein